MEHLRDLGRLKELLIPGSYASSQKSHSKPEKKDTI
jgi:DNA-binding sugar fermentation-stimulating protein